MSGNKKRKLPEGWRWEKLDKITANIQYGISKSSTSNKVGPKLLRITDIQDGKVDWNKVPFCECNSNEEKQYLLENNDIVFVRTGATTGKSFLLNDPENTLFASYLIRVQCNKELVNPKYLYTFFQTPIYWNHINQKSRGGTLAGFNASMLSTIEIPLPPTLSDQLAIASYLECRMAHVEKMRTAALRQKEAITAMQGAVLREVFSYTEGDELPEGWKWNIIKDVIENNIQIFNPENYDKEKFIYVDISSVDNVSKKILNTNQVLVKEAPSRAKSILKENDIIISTVRPNLNAVALVDKSRAGNICSSGFCVTRLKNGHHAPYFFNYLISPYFVEAVSNMVQGAMYPAISNDDVKDFSIPLPPSLSDQIAIAAELERKMAELEKARQAAERQLEAIKMLPGAILREVFDFEEENIGS